MAKEYVTKQELKDDMSTLMERIQKIDEKLDKLFEVKMARYRKKKQRVDLRNGGRVAYQRGGPNERVDQVRQDGLSGEMPIPTQRKPQTAPQPVAQTQAQQPIEQAPVVEEQVQQPVPTPAPTPTATPAATVTTPTTKAQPGHTRRTIRSIIKNCRWRTNKSNGILLG